MNRSRELRDAFAQTSRSIQSDECGGDCNQSCACDCSGPDGPDCDDGRAPRFRSRDVLRQARRPMRAGRMR